MVPGQTDTGGAAHRQDRIAIVATEPREDARMDLPGVLAVCAAVEELVLSVGDELQRAGQWRLQLTGRYEPVLATYDPGGGYLPHIDSNASDDRVLTAVYYLNEFWDSSLGGELRLHGTLDGQVDIFPEGDSLVLFRADSVLHEVLAAKAKRTAMSIWFTGVSSDGAAIDQAAREDASEDGDTDDDWEDELPTVGYRAMDRDA